MRRWLTLGAAAALLFAPDGRADDKAKAVEVEKEAALTPIVPSPHDPLKPAFQLYAEIDIPVLAMGVVFASARFIRTQRAYCGTTAAAPCDKSELNAFDRTTAGFYSPRWATLSDIGAFTLGAGAVALLVVDEGISPALNDLVVIAQAALLATAAPSMLTIATARPRPFLYGDKAPQEVRDSPDASMSFISSHTSVSFAIATSTFMAMKRRHPEGAFPWIVLGTGVALAGTVGTARVMAGRHFLTDAIFGAVIGTSMGVLIPALHKSPVKVVPTLDKASAGISVDGWF